MKNSFKTNIRLQLILASREYSKMLDKAIILESSKFQFENKYLLLFNKANFLHLTGVMSHLSANEFFDKCFSETIDENDFGYNEIKNKTNIKNKLKCLVIISSLFTKDIYVQEVFVKNRVVCKLATADNCCTIGFADGHYCLWPKTILSKNRLDSLKPTYLVKPIIKNKSSHQR